MPYAIAVYIKNGHTRFMPLSEDLSREEAVTAAIRWTKEEIGGEFLPKNTWMMRLFEIKEIDFFKENRK